jgi:hypothetical protein
LQRIRKVEILIELNARSGGFGVKKKYFSSVFRIQIGSGFYQVNGSGSIFGIRIQIQEGKNDPQE